MSRRSLPALALTIATLMLACHPEAATPAQPAPLPTLAPPQTPDGAPPEQLDKATIIYVMAAMKSRVAACYDRFRESGAVMIELVIERDGAVSYAFAIREFEGTRTGECVAEVIRTAHFPAHTGEPQRITYPFMLR
jgi:hypothetical protein